MDGITLKRVALFAGLPDDDLAALSRRAATRHYRKNTVIVSKDTAADTMYAVLSGRLRVYLDDDQGNEITIRFLESGDVFGELALLSDTQRSANVVTIEDCKLSVISRIDFMECLTGSPKMALHIIRTLVRRIQEMTDEISALALLDVYGRVRAALERLAKEHEGRRVTDRLTHQELANMVGSSREMVSRILRDLKAGGYISTDHKRITIEHDLPSGW